MEHRRHDSLKTAVQSRTLSNERQRRFKNSKLPLPTSSLQKTRHLAINLHTFVTPSRNHRRSSSHLLLPRCILCSWRRIRTGPCPSSPSCPCLCTCHPCRRHLQTSSRSAIGRRSPSHGTSRPCRRLPCP